MPRIFPGIVGASCKWSGWRRSDSSACARVGQSELKKRSRVIVVVTSRAYATNFRRLVLGFSEADSCKQILIFAFCNISKRLYLITSNYKIYTFGHRSKINLFAKKLTIVLTKCWPWVVQDWIIWWTFANIWLYWFNYLPTCQNLTGLKSVTVNFVKEWQLPRCVIAKINITFKKLFELWSMFLAAIYSTRDTRSSSAHMMWN